MDDAARPRTGLTLGRIQALTDGVFAIAMTLLVLTFKTPEEGIRLTAVALHKFLHGQATEFYSYVLSFILLTFFWLVHHWHFHNYRKTNTFQVWLNTLFLVFVVLIPYLTSLSGLFPHDWLVQATFCLNILMICLISTADWGLAVYKNNLIKHEIDPLTVKLIHQKNVTSILICVLACLVALLKPALSTYILLLLPINIIDYGKFRRRR